MTKEIQELLEKNKKIESLTSEITNLNDQKIKIEQQDINVFTKIVPQGILEGMISVKNPSKKYFSAISTAYQSNQTNISSNLREDPRVSKNVGLLIEDEEESYIH